MTRPDDGNHYYFGPGVYEGTISCAAHEVQTALIFLRSAALNESLPSSVSEEIREQVVALDELLATLRTLEADEAKRCSPPAS